MKIRNGFISNSSSSSFVVAFPKKPQDTKELQEMMFTSFQEQIEMFDQFVATDEICRRVFNEIQEQNLSATGDEIAQALAGYHNLQMDRLLGSSWSVWSNVPKEKDFDSRDEFLKADKDYWDKHRLDSTEYERKEAQKFLRNNEDAFILCTEYEDHGRIEGVMEHGNIFRNLKHIRVSNH
jgi:hypothetical protein